MDDTVRRVSLRSYTMLGQRRFGGKTTHNDQDSSWRCVEGSGIGIMVR